MKQYHDHLKTILEHGTRKAPAREGMPGSLSLYGYQNRYDLSKGFPILTTKKINFKNIVVELLWFLRGDTNIKYLIDNGCNIWNEDAYNYYKKILKKHDLRGDGYTFEEFISVVKEQGDIEIVGLDGSTYKFGDCGKQYGWLWRSWEYLIPVNFPKPEPYEINKIDQIKELIEGLKKNPMSRRHIITAWNPSTLDDMALNACHAFVQFNCREISISKRISLYERLGNSIGQHDLEDDILEIFTENNIPKYYLDCHMYQRSADMFLGVPYNIASYALLTEIIAKIVGMIPGEFIHTFGDSHIYDNHEEQVAEILSRDVNKYPLPKLKIDFGDNDNFIRNINNNLGFLKMIRIEDFQLENYQSYPAIKAKLSTGLK